MQSSIGYLLPPDYYEGEDGAESYSGWEDHHLDFSLYCVFSKAGGVTDPLVNEARRSSVMEKTHVGPTGGGVHAPQPPSGRTAFHPTSRPQLNLFIMFVTVSQQRDCGGFKRFQAQVGVKKKQKQSQTLEKSCKVNTECFVVIYSSPEAMSTTLCSKACPQSATWADKTNAKLLMEASRAWS